MNLLSAEHIETRTTSPPTPAFKYDRKPRSLALPHQLDRSHRGLTLNALKRPLKSLRSRRLSNVTHDQSITTVKRTRSIFDLFHSARSRDRGDVSKEELVLTQSFHTTLQSNANAENSK